MKSIIVLALLIAGSAGGFAQTTYAFNLPAGYYAKKIGPELLADPSGETHSRQEVAGKVVVVIFSAPNMTQGGRQEKWSKILADDPGTRLSDNISFYLLEDMSAAGMFKGMARDSMRKDFTKDSRPFLILDETGEVFKNLGVPHNKTVILVYDKTSKLRDVETNLDDSALTVNRLKFVTAKLLAE